MLPIAMAPKLADEIDESGISSSGNDIIIIQGLGYLICLDQLCCGHDLGLHVSISLIREKKEETVVSALY